MSKSPRKQSAAPKYIKRIGFGSLQYFWRITFLWWLNRRGFQQHTESWFVWCTLACFLPPFGELIVLRSSVMSMRNVQINVQREPYCIAQVTVVGRNILDGGYLWLNTMSVKHVLTSVKTSSRPNRSACRRLNREKCNFIVPVFSNSKFVCLNNSAYKYVRFPASVYTDVCLLN